MKLQKNLLVDIENEELETRQGKKGDYQIQKAYVHTVDRNGSPERYPREVSIFPQKDPQGRAVPYKPGAYTVDPRSFRVNNGFLDLAFLQLVPAEG